MTNKLTFSISLIEVFHKPDPFVGGLAFYRLSEKGVQTLVWQNQAKAFEVSVFLRKTETSNRLRPKYLSDKL